MFNFRETPLPTCASRGRVLVPEPVIEKSSSLLSAFHGRDGKHEGMVYWLGRRVGGDCIVMSVVQPFCKHELRGVFSTPEATGAVMRSARRYHLGIVAQIHSHPGQSSIHSDGDDRLVLQAFDGMFSIVVGEYGSRGISVETGASVHQFIGGRWFLVSTETPDVLVSIPNHLEQHYE